MILSVLIPTTVDRVDMFTSLYNELQRQMEYMTTFHPTLGQIEILVDDSKPFTEGGLSIGKKREALVKRASGKYLCFLDSDDNVSPDYLETLVRLCQHDLDVCTFMNVSKFDNYWCIVDMSLFHENQQAQPGIIERLPWHICPVRSLYAKIEEFPDVNYGEDWDWFARVLNHCTSQARNKSILHQYNHSKRWSDADKIYELQSKQRTGTHS